MKGSLTRPDKAKNGLGQSALYSMDDASAPLDNASSREPAQVLAASTAIETSTAYSTTGSIDRYGRPK